MSTTINRLNIPKTYKQLGIAPRFVDVEFYKKNQGLINLLVFSNINSDKNYGVGANNINYNTPIRDYTKIVNGVHTMTGLPGLTFTQALTRMNRTGDAQRYLDLQNRGIITADQLRAFQSALADGLGANSPEISIAVPL